MENENINVENIEGAEPKEEGAQKTFTEEEVLKLIQSEADKRVNQALASQKKKYEKELSLSKLDDNEREKAEKDNLIAELQEKLAQYDIERNRSELKSVLSARGLSAEFADIVSISEDLEASQKNIDTLDKLFKAAVKAEVEKRLMGNAPRGNSSNKEGVMTREAWNKLSVAEQSKLYASNPEFYSQFLR